MQFGRAAQKQAPHKSFYSYRLMVKPDIAKTQTKGVCSGWTGVCHALDIIYVFGIPILTRGFLSSELDYHFSYSIISAWTNFAKTGHPGMMGHVKWEQAHVEASDASGNLYTNVLMLDPKHYRMEHFYKKTCDTFWKNKLGFN